MRVTAIVVAIWLAGLAAQPAAAVVVETGDVYFIGQPVPAVATGAAKFARYRLEWVQVDRPTTVTTEMHSGMAPVEVTEDGRRVAMVPTNMLRRKGVYVLSGESGIVRRRILLVDPIPDLKSPLSWPFGMIESRDQIERGAVMAEEFYRVGVRVVKTSMSFTEIATAGQSDNADAGRISAGLDAYLTRAKELGLLFYIQPGSNYAQIVEPENLDGPFYEGLRRIQRYYKGRIHYWSLGNEVNGGGYSKFTRQQYADVVRSMSKALKAADPAVKLAPGELYSNGGYLDMLARQEYRDFWDVLSVHKVCGLKGTPCAGVSHYLNGLQGLDKPIWDTEVASGSIYGGPGEEGIAGNMRSFFPHEGYDDEHGEIEKSVVRTFCLEMRDGGRAGRWLPAYYNPVTDVLGASMFLGYHYSGTGHTLWALRRRFTPEGLAAEVNEGGRTNAANKQEDAQNHKVAGWRTVCDMLYGAVPVTRIPNTDAPDPYAARPTDKYERADGYIYKYGREYIVILWQNTGTGKGDRKLKLTTDAGDQITRFDSFGNGYPLRNDGGVVKVWVPMNIQYLRGFTRIPKFEVDSSNDDEPYFVTRPTEVAFERQPWEYIARAYDPDVPATGNDSLEKIRYELVEPATGIQMLTRTREPARAGPWCQLALSPALVKGTVHVKIRATSEHGAIKTVEQAFDLKVVGEEEARPVIVGQPVTTFARAGWVWRWNAYGQDPRGYRLKYELVRGPEGMTIDGETGFVQWMPTSAGEYAAEVKAVATDGRSGTSVVTIMAE